ncbi:hypothetical protein C8A03DRAFT_33274 [Achaetomium macrosporum]|uniref:Uncharacterized protein n=1 Tax=Achaetomium macrosporum TaxID=79813 RepID=A0AAN7CAX0_9PEZI|nr:hypothetical protein C8A03DRAFT_33274 [Achaetomium macrosporum]
MNAIFEGPAYRAGNAIRGVERAVTGGVGVVYRFVTDANEKLAITREIIHHAHARARSEFLGRVTGLLVEELDEPDANTVLNAAGEICCKAASDTVKSVISRVLDCTFNAKQIELDEPNANTILNAARQIYCTAASATVKSLIFKLLEHTFKALGQNDMARALVIWKGIFTNHANPETLAFIVDNKSDLALFLINLVEPAKLYVTALGTSTVDDLHTSYRPYNELDLTQARNRHALICQLQRLAASLRYILLMGKQEQSLEQSLSQLNMNTELRSDFDGDTDITSIPATLTSSVKETRCPTEKWLFVNGIGGEYYWVQLYCEKLRDIFQRNIKGIFNRSDGILWDLVECAGERDINGAGVPLAQRTESSLVAQRMLKSELSAALREPGGFVVMIAYSQGCLLLRHVLQELVRDGGLQVAMTDRLRVFTFGNPSIDWKGTTPDGAETFLCEHVNHTEHFANREDFVAKLGVLRSPQERDQREAGFIHEKSSVFINNRLNWVGHLFGTQYSLNPGDYNHEPPSRLLACAGGQAMT